MIKKIFLSVLLSFISVVLFGRTIRVATYNVDNYLIGDRWVDGRYHKRYPKPELEKEAVRKVISTIKPDILVLQEMGGEKFLKELQSDLRAEGINFPFLTVMKGVDTTRHIGVLSKESFSKIIPYDHLTSSFSKKEKKLAVRRGLLEVCFVSEGFEWSLFGLHLKSRRSDKYGDRDSSKQRMDEAWVICEKIKERYPDPQKSNYIVLGDFNDLPKSKTLKYFLEFKKQGIANMLDARDSRGECWTYYREGYGTYSQIDYILISSGLLKTTKAKGASIVDAPFALKGSDHRMVYADLEFTKEN